MSSKRGFWRKCRITFRWCRIATLLAVLMLVCAFGWFNRVGLPDFLKRPLVRTLREHGVELEFSRLRLRFGRGLVADNVRIGLTRTTDSPVLSSSEIQLRLDFAALWHRQLQVDGLVLREGQLTLPWSPTNALTLTNLQAEVRFQTNDTWSFDSFKADFAGAKLSVNGDLLHAPELRHWEMFHARKTSGPPSRWPDQLKKISDTLAQIHFSDPPRLVLTVNGDARDLETFDLRFTGSAPGVDTPWGSARAISLSLHANPQSFDHLPETTLRLVAAEVVTPQGSVHGLRLDAQLAQNPGAATNVDATEWWWTNAQPYRLAWTMQLDELKTDQLAAGPAECSGFWQAPKLTVTSLFANLGGGSLDAAAQLNVATRELTFTNASNFDLHAVAALLTEKTRTRLAEFSWTQPPVLHASGSLMVPAWTNRSPEWRAEAQPTIRLNGEIAFTEGAAFGMKLDSARTHFSYSNLVWNLPDVTIAQAKTKLELSGSEDDATKKYAWHIRGAFDLEAARPFMPTGNATHGFSQLRFTEPVVLDADLTGRLYDYEGITARGQLTWTNFSYRGQSADSVAAGFSYTNRVLEILHPRLWRAGGAETLTADAVVLDFNTKLISFTNGFSTAEPMAVVNAIGPKTAKLIEPYVFLAPPVARVNGRVPLRDVKGGHDLDEADMQFEILQGVPFRWLKLQTTNILGTIHWEGQALFLTNVTAKLYGGDANGFASFDFRPKHKGADYQFFVAATNVNLHLLATGLSSATNRLEGVLDAVVVVTNASTESLQSWNGYGSVHLRDGLLWDVSIFGIFSQVLNAVSPGLGNSQAKEAAAKFSITNGVIATDALEIRLAMTRLQYSGTVNLSGDLDARVTAQLLRDIWGVGPVFSTVFWPVSKLFEYQVSGTLKNPKSEPVHDVSKVIMMPLHPIRTFELLLPANESNGEFFSIPTNAPPGK